VALYEYSVPAHTSTLLFLANSGVTQKLKMRTKSKITPRQIDAGDFREPAPVVDTTGTSGVRVTDNHRVTGSNRLIPVKIASMPAIKHCPSPKPLEQAEEKSSNRRTQLVRLY
jgi:hypothetical protein